MQFELLMCLLLHISNGNKTFVKEYTTAKITCPLKLTEKDNVSWYYEESKPIVIMNVINPEFKFKYSINSALNEGKSSLNIYNFTKSNEGKYSCQGIVGGEHQEGIVTVSLCKMSELLSTFSKYLNVNVWRHAVRQRYVLCSDGTTIFSNRSDSYDLFNDFFKLKDSPQLTGIVETNKDKMKGQTDRYICFTVTGHQCSITDVDSEFHLKIEWISSEEKEHRKLNNSELYTYTCTCNLSGVEENTSCNESIDAYVLNKTLLFKEYKMINDGTYQCSLAQNKTDNWSTNTRLPKWASGIIQVYLLIGASVVCGMVIVGVFILASRRGLYDHPNATNPPESLHSGLPDDQEHGSVDNEYEEIDSVSYHSVNLRSYGFENTNRLNSENDRVSDNRPISSSSRSSLTLFHFYINTSIGSTNNMPASYENELSHPSQLGTCDIWTNNSQSNNTSESGTLQVNQYMNIANSDFPNEYEDLKHQSGDTHTYETLPSDG
ncbi:uncharacterized protein LOC127712669 [Mytilus californianus]|uniref:uncharacterized protein LOC127712669 n=1 Tax=Mytilus californianus TaxID=6549 RepID=UPI0022482CDC|nr:uncharacterized protein LOC127712669 [Mytilus californianus]XP_052075215.1 uncharacterized protein LOC127712669 [Mytilus californianus]